ncbi:putative DEAD-box ATP-dependent RNA helicase CshB [Gemella bergeri ATCC 700627]|uniref:Putative DEAD-box ATP-dependent RNA helicase CshB n=1 Tax=Gemella bergeri ATCC 700627 TaxID=1321820 RepID=U2RRE8_9BACL|nr:DEAD/DEAH box helicase [Gemella bergeri]ERK56113.1 putative DEAD-box ATP-dependent RNA helicase CshB [Gemella bergeri ATCC 700627]
MLSKSFEQYGFKDFVNKAIIDLGFKNPTKIQERVFSPVLKEKNIVARSQTGSGKSHSFLLPIFSKLDLDRKKTQGIILAPTRELSRQLYEMAVHIATFSEKEIKITLCIGGQDLNRDIERVSNAPHIIIGTPTRVLELDRANALSIKEVETLVIDECDMMIDLGFMEDIDKLSKRAATNCQFLVFSATIPTQMSYFLKKYLNNAQHIDVDNAKFGKIDYILIPEKSSTRLEKLYEITTVLNPYLALIFANKKTEVEEISNYLIKQGLNVGVLHGDLTPRERKQMQRRINNLDFTYVVASDLMSRGIDIEGISHVINFNIPNDLDFFIHRAGRTGRAGLSGECITIYNSKDEEKLQILENRGIKFNHVDIKNGQFIEVKDRNKRQSRKKIVADHNLTEKLKSKVKVSKKVKPGYKKKYKYKMDKLKQKERRKFAKRMNRTNRGN